MKLKLVKTIPTDKSVIYLINKKNKLTKLTFTKAELDFIQQKLKDEATQITINHYSKRSYIQIIENDKPAHIIKENLRKAANKLLATINDHKEKEIIIVDEDSNSELAIAFAEGLTLGNYQFLKYFKDSDKKSSSLKTINIFGDKISQNEVDQIQNTAVAVAYARDLVNEPLSYLTAPKLAEEIVKLGKEAGFETEVFNKKKIETLKMGGLLAVNKGSIDPPTFSVMDWKPKNAVNKKPIILVGKGIVFDTGGLSLKPTKNSMDYMKSDMGGAAAVVGALYAIAKNKLPIHVIGLIPATDNRPNGNAYAPGDVIKMHNGLTVEVLNTDAEGRMILADALSYAQKYDPELVIDVATLTGAAAAAVGSQGIVCMGNAEEKTFEKLKKSGENVYERLVEFPFWEEYGEMIKSDIADLKNVGGSYAGAITAGKFLENFTDYPYIHIDIAGSAFAQTADSYRGKGGTGVGVRLLFDFIGKWANK